MQVKVNNEWHYITDFDGYEEVEALGEIQDADGIPAGLDLEKNWDEIQEYIGLSEEEQAIMMAYYEATDCFDWSEAQEAYIGTFQDGAEFSATLCEELGYISKDLPSLIAYHIDWQGVWDSELRHDYFEVDGKFFRNL